MSVRWTRRAVAAFLLLYVFMVTWPGILPFNRVDPHIFGMPFVMAWHAGLLMLMLIVLYYVDKVESRERRK